MVAFTLTTALVAASLTLGLWQVGCTDSGEAVLGSFCIGQAKLVGKIVGRPPNRVGDGFVNDVGSLAGIHPRAPLPQELLDVVGFGARTLCDVMRHYLGIISAGIIVGQFALISGLE